jgi:hypothetical protein
MENIEAMLCAYIEGDLDAAGRAQIEKHLQDHPQHRKLIQELSAMRDLVRGLPRIKAPMEIGESLRGKVERSILLGDSGDTEEQSEHGNRWPQMFAIAAIFLLCASLGLVLYKALGPTMKPPVFTDGVASKLSVVMPPTDLVTSPAIPTTQESSTADITADTKQAAPGSPSPSSVVAAASPASQEPSRALNLQQEAVATQFNVDAIRQRLLDSGYNIMSAGANASSPVLMVVNSTNLPATNAQVTHFLNDSSGISWKKVPIGDETKSIPATLPSANAVANGEMSVSTDEKVNLDRESGASTTQPASDVYVAKGLTSQQADALRQALAVPQNGDAVQVFMQQPSALATTQPSVMVARKDIAPIHGGLAAASTQPAETAKLDSALAGPTTLPANESAIAQSPVAIGGNRDSAVDYKVSDVNGSAVPSDNLQTAPPADTVIVIQSSATTPLTPVSAGMPLSTVRVPAELGMPAATQPSPSTQP